MPLDTQVQDIKGRTCKRHARTCTDAPFLQVYSALALAVWCVLPQLKRILQPFSGHLCAAQQASCLSRMSDLQTLHKTARSLILSLREGIEQLEKSEQVR